MSTLITIEIHFHLMPDEAQILSDLADALAGTPLDDLLGENADSGSLIMSHIKRQLLKAGVEPTRFKREREVVPDDGSRLG